MNSQLITYLEHRIRENGPLSFRDYMDAVLYHPDFGYYTSSTRIGREGDFYTSSDLDPILGKLLANYFAQLAEGIDNFAVLELGAGKGLLARDILRHRRFRYQILERSSGMRSHQKSVLSSFDVEWLDDLPTEFSGCVFSNEFFDALPVHRFIGRAGGVKEIFVTEHLQESERDPGIPIDFSLADGQIADINVEARLWIRRIAQSLRGGYHVAIDYGYLRDQFFSQARGTLMCYWRHQAHENPYINVGDQDITAHVNFSDLIDEGNAAGLDLVRFSSQKDFLVDLGILHEIQQLAYAGTAESMQRLLRMKNLIVPDRMGERFKVLVQEKNLK
jgi:SAM-dependent MidA family methyltransferase